ncbi:hypothetical protein GCM10027435_02780 [Haloparvum alkalitolerans]|uniref:class I SAM-dependent methyltransferase n=1 Tax=Haloparvum alkalitolerans TaxID=1042953 RepID=UPI003CEA8EC9
MAIESDGELQRMYEENHLFNLKEDVTAWKVSHVTEVLEEAGITSCDSIVELGFGSGEVLSLLSEWFDAEETVGLDFSTRAVYVADEIADEKRCIVGDAQRTPIKDKKFDVCCLMDILEHVREPVTVLEEAIRIAETVIAKVPIEYNYCRRAQNKLGIFTWEDSKRDVGHVHWWTLADIQKIVERFDVRYSQLTPSRRHFDSHDNPVRTLAGNMDAATFRISRSLYHRMWGGNIVYIINS